MKKYIFLCFVFLLIILMLIYFYDRKEMVSSRVYRDNNIYIEYPYFNNKYLDDYIGKFIFNYINNTDYKSIIYLYLS